MRVVTDTQNRTDGERLTGIEATLPHLATRADLENGLRGVEDKLSGLERRMLWAALGFALGIGANIVVSLLT